MMLFSISSSSILYSFEYYIYICGLIYVCMYACMYICTSVYLYIYIYVCLHLFICLFVSVYVYVFIGSLLCLAVNLLYMYKISPRHIHTHIIRF